MDNNFHYNVVPAGTKVSTRVVFQEPMTQNELIALVVGETGLTSDQVTSAGTSILKQVILGAQKGRKSQRLFGLMTFTPRCGGVHADADFQPNVANMNLAVNATLSPGGIALLEGGISFTRDAVLGEKVPEIDRVYDGTTRGINRCTPGGAFRIGGRDFGFEPNGGTSLGVFLKPVAGGAAVRVVSYSDWTGTEIMGSWPAALTGAQNLSIVAQYSTGGSFRTGMYGTPLSP